MGVMNKAFIVIVLFLSTFGFASGGVSLDGIDALEWKNRVVLVWSNDRIEDLKAIFDANQYEIDDRDILWFIIYGDQVYTNYTGSISQSFVANTNERYFTKRGNVLLIGKDGGIKKVADSLDLENLFRAIDSMPMRKLEMKTKTNDKR
jgi:hypothetical protein